MLQFGVGGMVLWGKFRGYYTPSGYLFVTTSFMMAARRLTAFKEVEDFAFTGDNFTSFLDNIYYPFGISVLMFISVGHYIIEEHKRSKAS